MSLAVSLDPDALVVIWGEDKEELIKPYVAKQMVNKNFRGWYWRGKTCLKTAIASWQWNQENLGKTFADSIYIVSEVWIFPVDFDVPQNWQDGSIIH